MQRDKDKHQFGPSRAEHRLRLGVSLLGLLLLTLLLARDGLSLAVLEPVLIGLAFFGVSAAWSARALLRR